MSNNSVQEFIRSLRDCLNAEIANCEQPAKSCAFPKMLDEVAITLERQGIALNLIQLAMLALCGVPIQPVSYLSLPAPVVFENNLDLEKAFLAGFMASGEGWNGEDPNRGNKVRAWEGGVKEAYRKWHETWTFANDPLMGGPK